MPKGLGSIVGYHFGRLGRPAIHVKVDVPVMKIIRVYVGPLVLLSLGVFFFVLAVITPIRTAADLSEIRGHLDSHHIYRDSRGRYPKAIVTLIEGQRFWTDALDSDISPVVLKERGMEVRTYVLPNSTSVPIDNAVKSYGLWVNGQQIASMDDEIANEALIYRFGFPAVGIFMLTLAIYVYLKCRKRYAM